MLSIGALDPGSIFSLRGIFFGSIPSPITDLEISGLRRRYEREQPPIGFEIEQRCAL
jgi:hypothetical protein